MIGPIAVDHEVRHREGAPVLFPLVALLRRVVEAGPVLERVDRLAVFAFDFHV
jgi:hypothetical protein